MLGEIGRVYVPFLLANAQAVMTGAKSFETTIDGRAWSQPTFPYQAKCLKWIWMNSPHCRLMTSAQCADCLQAQAAKHYWLDSEDGYEKC